MKKISGYRFINFIFYYIYHIYYHKGILNNTILFMIKFSFKFICLASKTYIDKSFVFILLIININDY